MNCTVHGVAKSQTRLSDFHFHRLVEGLRVWEEAIRSEGCGSWKSQWERLGVGLQKPDEDEEQLGGRCFRQGC